MESKKQESKKPVSSTYVCEKDVPFENVTHKIKETEALNLLSKYRDRHNITVLCSRCEHYIQVKHMQTHQLYHRALRVLKYGDKSHPQNLSDLITQYKALTKKIRNGLCSDYKAESGKKSLKIKMLSQLNESYELLRANLEENSEKRNELIAGNIDENVHGMSLGGCPPCVLGVGVCNSVNSQWRNTMEDTWIYQNCFGKDTSKCYLGVFDGYHGKTAASVASKELHQFLLKQLSKFEPEMTSGDLTGLSQYQLDKHVSFNEFCNQLHDESKKMVKKIMQRCQKHYNEFFMGESKGKNLDVPKKNHISYYKEKLNDEFVLRISEAFKKAYELTDKVLSHGECEFSAVRWSGCSALTAIIHNTYRQHQLYAEEKHLNEESIVGRAGYSNRSRCVNPKQILGKIYLANAGNVNAVIVRDNKAFRLSRNHSLKNAKERARILKQGGTMTNSDKECLVNGVLATTRGLGNHGDQDLKKCVLVKPFVACADIEQQSQFLIVASNGLWQALSEQEAASLLLQLLPKNQISSSRNIGSSSQLFLDSFKTQPGQLLHRKAENDCTNVCCCFSATEGNYLNSVEISSCADDGGVNGDVKKNQIENHRTQKLDKGNLYLKREPEFSTYSGLIVSSKEQDDSYAPSTQHKLQQEFAQAMAEHLVRAALLAGSRDNITVMVVLLPGYTM